jgi:hypothetical protein
MITSITNLHDAMFKLISALAVKDPSKDPTKDKDKAQERESEQPGESAAKRADVKEAFRLLRKVDDALLERLFILQVAVEDGWTTAKDVAFYKAGIRRK